MQIIDKIVTQKSGGTGGYPFNDEGQLVEVLTGLEVWSNKWVDAVRPIYSELGFNLGGYRLGGGRFGGGGGSWTQVWRDGWVVVQLSIRSGWYVDSIELTWQRWSNGQLADEFDTQTVGGSGGQRSEVLRLPSGFVACGVHGRADSWLDALGLVGGRPG